MDLTLDINCELYPIKSNEKFTLMLSKSLTLDEKEKESQNPSFRLNSTIPSLADKYDYVMFGKVYKLEDTPSNKM
jgi:DNA-directed RNA polymerase I, II, and III subunit RPABC3